VKSKCILYFLAVGLFSAMPAFADKISVSSAEQDGKSVSIDELLKENQAKTVTSVLDFSRGVLSGTGFASPTNISDRDGTSILEALFSPKENKSKGDAHFILFDLKQGNPYGRNGGRIKDKHKPIQHEGYGLLVPAVAVPEPGSFTLVLFGLGTICILLCRRNSQ
jgi:PEP-CTERM motif